jgi:hypothetical protein
MNEFILKKKYQNHLSTKQLILSDIAKMGSHSVYEFDQRITNTDWHLNSTYERKYIEHFFPEIQSFINDINSFYFSSKKPEKLSLANFWFQQYHSNDFHGYHIHSDSVFSCVYYLEFPNQSSKTSFRCMGKEFEFDVCEGDIICFPSFMQHSSKPNQSNRKTVIAFNVRI